MNGPLEIVQADALNQDEICIYLSDGRSLVLNLNQILKAEHRVLTDDDDEDTE